VLVTGAAGFVGGHIARHLARSGHEVRGLTRGPTPSCPDDPRIEWIKGDLRDPATRREAVAGRRAVIHAASWVSLGRDPGALSQAINVEATRSLLDDAKRAGVARFVLTSSLHTLAAGTVANPADETTAWNLGSVDSPYCRSKREAEHLVRQASQDAFATIVLCPGMVVGPRDPKPTSTRLLHVLARSRIVFLPGGGIPIVDANVVAQAHRMALTRGEPGERYAVVGPYLSYAELAGLVRQITGRPQVILPVLDMFERPLQGLADLLDRLGLGSELSGTTVAGGFLRLHVSGNRADLCFRLEHPAADKTIRSSLSPIGT
jgi:dihydroflavonol-4-reductase